MRVQVLDNFGSFGAQLVLIIAVELLSAGLNPEIFVKKRTNEFDAVLSKRHLAVFPSGRRRHPGPHRLIRVGAFEARTEVPVVDDFARGGLVRVTLSKQKVKQNHVDVFFSSLRLIRPRGLL